MIVGSPWWMSSRPFWISRDRVHSNGYHFEGKSLLRGDKPDETIVEHYTGMDGRGCDSFLLLRGQRESTWGAMERLLSWRSLKYPLPPGRRRLPGCCPHQQIVRRLDRLARCSLANRKPATIENRIEADPRLREQLRALGYVD